MNPDLLLKHSNGKLDNKHIRRHRNLRKVSSAMDPDELDRLSSHEGMRAKGAGWRTDLGPDAHVLVKFLDHRLGRQWDQVFSEVSHSFGREGREIVREEVLTHTVLDAEGRIVVNDTPWCGLFLKEITGTHLYVNPADGTLRRAGKPYSHHASHRDVPTAVIISGIAYYRRNGLWFSTLPATLRGLVVQMRARGTTKGGFSGAYMLLARRLRNLPTLWTPATGDFVCDPDATRQVSARRVTQLKLDEVSIAAVAA